MSKKTLTASQAATDVANSYISAARAENKAEGLASWSVLFAALEEAEEVPQDVSDAIVAVLSCDPDTDTANKVALCQNAAGKMRNGINNRFRRAESLYRFQFERVDSEGEPIKNGKGGKIVSCSLYLMEQTQNPDGSKKTVEGARAGENDVSGPTPETTQKAAFSRAEPAKKATHIQQAMEVETVAEGGLSLAKLESNLVLTIAQAKCSDLTNEDIYLTLLKVADQLAVTNATETAK